MTGLKTIAVPATVTDKYSNTRTPKSGPITDYILVIRTKAGSPILQFVGADAYDSANKGGTVDLILYQLPNGIYHPSKCYADLQRKKVLGK